MLKFKLKKKRGFTLVEAVLAVSVFSLLVLAFSGVLTASLQTGFSSDKHDKAVFLVEEGLEVVKNLRDDAYNSLILSQTGLDGTGDEWAFLGESSSETIGDYTRTISINPLCRNTLDEIVDCPGDYEDIHYRIVTVSVVWQEMFGQSKSIQNTIMLSDWEAYKWEQSDWSGGAGQTVWSDNTRYSSDDGNISVDSGVVKLKALSAACTSASWGFDNIADYSVGCSNAFWGFSNSASYIFDSNEMEVVSGLAQLKSQTGHAYIEVGKVKTDEKWKTVSLVNTYISPVITAFPLRDKNSKSVSVRIKNVTADSFQIRLQHANNPEENLKKDKIYYLVVEEGSWQLHNTKIEAHKYQTSTIGSKSGGWNGDVKSYSNTYMTAPIVLHQVMSDNDSSWVSSFVSSQSSQSFPPSNSGFQIALNLAEAGTSHGAETIGWIAIESDITDSVNGVDFETVKTTDSIEGNGTSYNQNFNNNYSDKPRVIGSQQKMNDSDGGWLVGKDIKDDRIKLFIDEDTFVDAERNHDTEIGGLVVFADSFSADLGTFIYYSDNNPVITPSGEALLNSSGWTGFNESAVKNGGEIYYQISGDNGNTWKYWDGEDWSVAGGADYNTASVVDSNISSFSFSKTPLFKAFLVGDGSTQISLDSVSFECNDIEISGGTARLKGTADNAYIESGFVSTDETWVTVSLENTYISPVIVAYVVRDNNTGPVSARIRNVTSSQFEIRLQNADDPENNLMADKIYYLVVEEGSWTMGSTQIEAHSYQTSTVAYKNNWNGDDKSYSHTYGTAPIVLHQVMSYNDSSWVTTFVSSQSSKSSPPTTSGFQIALNLAEAGTSHGAETIGWIAIEAEVTDSLGTVSFETQKTSDGIKGNGTTYTQNFDNNYSVSPIVLGSQQEMDGNDGGWLMGKNLTAAKIDLFVDEDVVGGSERNHTTETGAVLVFKQSFSADLGSGVVYSSANPFLRPVLPVASSGQVWAGFTEVATKNGGQIYYQISDDDGVSWKYWDGAAWALAGIADYNTAEEVNTNLIILNSVNTPLFKAFLSGDGASQVILDNVTVQCADFQTEMGSISLNNNWQTISMQNTYISPVIFANYYESDNNLSVSVRINNKTQNSFDMRLENPSGSSLNSDLVYYWVVEEGIWDLNGTQLEVHEYNTDTVGSSSGGWVGDVVSFDNTYATPPVVLHQVQSANDVNWISSFVMSNNDRSYPPDEDDMMIGLNGAQVTSSHGAEDIGWMAIDSGAVSAVDGVAFETFRAAGKQGHDTGCYLESYQNSYSTVPLPFISQISMAGSDGSWSVVCDNSSTQIGVHSEEDQVADSERMHYSENVGYVVFGSVYRKTVSADGYELGGEVYSSYLDTGDLSDFLTVEWSESLPVCTGCDLQIQLRTAPDAGGSPGLWSDWYGVGGAGTSFTNPVGNFISQDLNGNRWAQYKVILSGDGLVSPALNSIYISYK